MIEDSTLELNTILSSSWQRGQLNQQEFLTFYFEQVHHIWKSEILRPRSHRTAPNVLPIVYPRFLPTTYGTLCSLVVMALAIIARTNSANR